MPNGKQTTNHVRAECWKGLIEEVNRNLSMGVYSGADEAWAELMDMFDRPRQYISSINSDRLNDLLKGLMS